MSPPELYQAKSIERPLSADDASLFPELTERGPRTDVYQEETPEGFAPVTAKLKGAHDHEQLASATTTLAGDASEPAAKAEKDLEASAATSEWKIVTWTEEDPENPRRLSLLRKWTVTWMVTLLCFTVAIGSSIITGGLEPQMEEFGVSEVVINLTISTFVISFGTGPLLLAPMSEVIGRRWVYISSMVGYFIFTIPCAVAQNVETIIVTRLIAGFFASSPMCVGASSIADVWDADVRGIKMGLFSCMLFAGPCIGPVVGGFITETIGWRYMYWVLLAWVGLVTVLTFFLLPETYSPVLLRRRAERLRKETGDDTFVTEQELNKRSPSETIYEMLVRPFQIMAEPIMICFSGYLSLIYTLLYAFFFAYPEVLIKGHGWSASQCGLAFLSILVGIALVGITCVPLQERYYARRVKEARAQGVETPPEARLPMMMVNAILLPISLFIFAFTSWPWVSPWGPVVAGIPFGYALIGIYVSANSYLVDAFPRYAASAMAAKTFIRSECGASVPLWIIYLYAGAGPAWAGSVFAFVSLAMCPIPFVFFYKGATIRARSKRAS